MLFPVARRFRFPVSFDKNRRLVSSRFHSSRFPIAHSLAFFFFFFFFFFCNQKIHTVVGATVSPRTAVLNFPSGKKSNADTRLYVFTWFSRIIHAIINAVTVLLPCYVPRRVSLRTSFSRLFVAHPNIEL